VRQFHRPASKRPASRVLHVESAHTRVANESRTRIILVSCFFGLCFVMLGVRLFEVATVGGGDFPFKRLVTEPQLMLTREDDVDASKVAETEKVIRHEIVDRNGLVLATSIETASLVANPTIIRHENEVAAGLHRIFPEEPLETLRSRLMQKNSTFLYIHRHLTPTQQQAVNNLGVPGLFFEPDMRRVYPYGGLFSHIIGYVGVDNQGLAGIEKYFDRSLQDASHDAPLQLSLDLRVQSMMREELAKAMQEFGAVGATGVVLSIPDGEVIAVTSLPEFDPHQPGRASPDALFNRATLGVYELGSTFKTFTFAGALENGSVTMRGGYDASRPIHIGTYTISDAHPEGRWLSVPEIFAHSSNIGTAKMALDLGAKRQQAFLKSLGLFEPVKLEVPELARPIVPREWPPITAMTVSYGHGISVSPMHLAQAYATVAGDGTPHGMTLLKDGNKDRATGPRALSMANVSNLRDLLRLVVMHGTAKSANVAGYDMGGKTGTAEKNTNGIYMKNAKVTSFAGVFPASNPKYVMLVVVDEPKGNKSTYGFATGGWIAAPVVARVVQRMAPMLGMEPQTSANDARLETLWSNAQPHARTVVARTPEASNKEAIRAVSY
jgi:cell division protein FtsI (penicillin-binding protein 3)